MKKFLIIVLFFLVGCLCFGCGVVADAPNKEENIIQEVTQNPPGESTQDVVTEPEEPDTQGDVGDTQQKTLPWPRAESRYTDYEDFFWIVRRYYNREMETGLNWSYNGTRVKVVQKADRLSVVNKESRDLHAIDFPLDESVVWVAADSNWIYGVRDGMELFRMDYWGEQIETLFYDGTHTIETDSGYITLVESVALFFAAVSEEGSMICRLYLQDMTLDVMATTSSPEVALEIPITNHAVIWWEPNPKFETLYANLMSDSTAALVYWGDDAKDRISRDYGVPIQYKHYASTWTNEHIVTEDYGVYVSERSYYAEDSAQYMSIYYCATSVDFREYYIAPAGTEDWALLKSSGEICGSGEDSPHGFGYYVIRYVAEYDPNTADAWRIKGVCVGVDGSGNCEEDVPDEYWEDIQLVDGTIMMSWKWSAEEGSYLTFVEADLCEDCPDFWPNHRQEPREQDAVAKLTGEELQWFNDEFFNRGRAGNDGTLFDSMPNIFLTSTYENVAEIDPLLLFYDGDGVTTQDVTQTELDLLAELGCMTRLDVDKLTCEGMDAVLYEYADIGVDSLAADLFVTPGLTYLEEYDAWYHFHGDTNWSRYEMTAGYWNDNGSVDLYYENKFLSYRECFSMHNSRGSRAQFARLHNACGLNAQPPFYTPMSKW